MAATPTTDPMTMPTMAPVPRARVPDEAAPAPALPRWRARGRRGDVLEWECACPCGRDGAVNLMAAVVVCVAGRGLQTLV